MENSGIVSFAAHQFILILGSFYASLQLKNISTSETPSEVLFASKTSDGDILRNRMKSG